MMTSSIRRFFTCAGLWFGDLFLCDKLTFIREDYSWRWLPLRRVLTQLHAFWHVSSAMVAYIQVSYGSRAFPKETPR